MKKHNQEYYLKIQDYFLKGIPIIEYCLKDGRIVPGYKWELEDNKVYLTSLEGNIKTFQNISIFYESLRHGCIFMEPDFKSLAIKDIKGLF